MGIFKGQINLTRLAWGVSLRFIIPPLKLAYLRIASSNINHLLISTKSLTRPLLLPLDYICQMLGKPTFSLRYFRGKVIIRRFSAKRSHVFLLAELEFLVQECWKETTTHS